MRTIPFIHTIVCFTFVTLGRICCLFLWLLVISSYILLRLKIFKNCFAILILTCLLNGVLYQMFRPLFLVFRVCCSFSNVSFSEYLHLSKMSLWKVQQNLFITGIRRNTFWNRFQYFFQYRWRVIWFCINIWGNIVGLIVWFKQSCS